MPEGCFTTTCMFVANTNMSYIIVVYDNYVADASVTASVREDADRPLVRAAFSQKSVGGEVVIGRGFPVF